MTFTRRGLLAVALAAAAALAPASAAATDLEMSPAGNFTARSTSNIAVTFGSIPMTCTFMSASGTVSREGVGRIALVIINNCTSIFGSSTIPSTGPWELDTTFVYDAGQTYLRWRGTGPTWRFSPWSTCNFNATGPLDFIQIVDLYPVVQTTLTLDTRLVATNAACGSIVTDGGTVTLRGTLGLSPTQTIRP